MLVLSCLKQGLGRYGGLGRHINTALPRDQVIRIGLVPRYQNRYLEMVMSELDVGTRVHRKWRYKRWACATLRLVSSDERQSHIPQVHTLELPYLNRNSEELESHTQEDVSQSSHNVALDVRVFSISTPTPRQKSRETMHRARNPQGSGRHV